MKAFLIDRYGKHQGRLAEVPDPEPGIHDVLVKVHASSVNQLDSKISKGEFKLILPYTFPLIMGNDLAGVVVRVGSGVRTFKPGDEVYARPPDARIGGFAELIAIEESALALKPNNTSMEQAAALPLVALTAWQVLVETARVKKGQKASALPNWKNPCAFSSRVGSSSPSRDHRPPSSHASKSCPGDWAGSCAC